MLDSRLALCAETVTGDFVCDIGTDHAYLPCELVASGKCRGGIGADVNSKPLEFAAATVEKYGLSDKIRLVLSDGLADVDTSEVTDIVIAGMGGELISRILSDGLRLNKFGSDTGLILQPMTRAAELRRYLCAEGYEIISEKAAVDGRFTYSVIRALHSGKCSECDDVRAELGALDMSLPESKKYAAAQSERLKKIAEGLSKSGKTEEAEKYSSLAKRICTAAEI